MGDRVAAGRAILGPLDAASPELKLNAIPAPEQRLNELSLPEIDDLWREARCASVDLAKNEFAALLLSVGEKHNFGLPPAAVATAAQIADYWRGLQLQDLALAHACALGRDAAWQMFMTEYKQPLTQAAIAITGSAARGQELADSLYAELFGVSERGEQRRSPLAYYSGRGSLKGFLRATLAQRNVDHFRRTGRETTIPDGLPAAPLSAPAGGDVVAKLNRAVAGALGTLQPEERFVLSAWYLDKRTLLEISRLLGVHEATVSRRLQRLTARLHEDLLRKLRESGMSRAAAEEALGTDPRDLDINLRKLLQNSQSSAFLQKGASAQGDEK